jgi:hypothetical protein
MSFEEDIQVTKDELAGLDCFLLYEGGEMGYNDTWLAGCIGYNGCHGRLRLLCSNLFGESGHAEQLQK